LNLTAANGVPVPSTGAIVPQLMPRLETRQLVSNIISLHGIAQEYAALLI
jgi:hypothetical protein